MDESKYREMALLEASRDEWEARAVVARGDRDRWKAEAGDVRQALTDAGCAPQEGESLADAVAAEMRLAVRSDETLEALRPGWETEPHPRTRFMPTSAAGKTFLMKRIKRGALCFGCLELSFWGPTGSPPRVDRELYPSEPAAFDDMPMPPEQWRHKRTGEILHRAERARQVCDPMPRITHLKLEGYAWQTAGEVERRFERVEPCTPEEAGLHPLTPKDCGEFLREALAKRPDASYYCTLHRATFASDQGCPYCEGAVPKPPHPGLRKGVLWCDEDDRSDVARFVCIRSAAADEGVRVVLEDIAEPGREFRQWANKDGIPSLVPYLPEPAEGQRWLVSNYDQWCNAEVGRNDLFLYTERASFGATSDLACWAEDGDAFCTHDPALEEAR